MRHRIHKMILALGCGLILYGSATEAQAGFIVTTLDAIQDDSTEGIGAGNSSPSTPDDQEVRRDHSQPAFLAGLTSTSSMAPPSATGQGGPTTAAMSPATPVPTTGELTLRLSQQREPYHPRFIKSRLFRPPRS